MGRHNMRPNHLHVIVEAPGFRKLTTAFYPEGDEYLASDAVFGVKHSLVVVSVRAADLACRKPAHLEKIEIANGER